MNSQTVTNKEMLIKLFALLDYLGFSFDTYEACKDTRKQFQKLVYALQVNGFRLGYNYNLYINGPYSPSLATDGYCIARDLSYFQEYKDRVNLTSKGWKKIEDTNNLLDGHVHDVDWLETVCTMHFIANHMSGEISKEKVYIKFTSIKPHLSCKSLMDKAWAQIEGTRNE